ncbi:hypothetical protein TrVFT333_011184 [Trichoderma virens FT-333]|nr:hypothetical protein TrVFT333_011184 [Trichoderma virens FT-333]
MGQTTSPPRRPRHAAMRDDGGSYDYRERPRSGRGVTSSDRPGSPPHGARHSSDYASRQHHRPRDSAPAHRHRSRDRSRDYSRRERPASSRPPADSDDLIPRYRESKARSSEAKARTTRGSRSRSLRRRAVEIKGPSPNPSDEDTIPPNAEAPHRVTIALPTNLLPESRTTSATIQDIDLPPTLQQDPRPTGDIPDATHGTATNPKPLEAHRGNGLHHLPAVDNHFPIAGAHRDRKRGKEFSEPHHASRSDIDDDMTSRSSYRGGYNPTYSHQSHHSNDPRGYSQSPQNSGSFHNSPSPSSYGAGRSGWNHQYSAQQQYPPSMLTLAAVTLPVALLRMDHRITTMQIRCIHPLMLRPLVLRVTIEGVIVGVAFVEPCIPGAAAAAWPSPRNNGFPSDEEVDRRSTAADADAGATADIETTDANENASLDRPDDAPSAPTNHMNASKDGTEVSSQPTPKPSSGAGKFSFAFKPSSKPTPATPKPEISQKFNAAPPRREPVQQAQTTNRDREPPPSAPTEPSSARSRREFRNPPEGPKLAPRTRKVIKVMKRPKPRPTLPDDLIESDSVFFRKPGNESVVGSGTYGKVFKGLNVYTKGLVALKRIRMEGERDGFPVTAVREIKLLQSLRHTNIVNLQEVMVEKNDCFMVFEYLSHDLTGLLNHPSFTLDPAQKKHMAKQLFEGLDYLHERGVLHRDIKAANILVSSEGILKLADFGLARFYAKRHQLDYTNRVITIWYRSPELLLGETKYTAAVDVWSAACVMVEIFTRLAIFAGDGTELSQLDKIYNILGTPTRHDWPGITDMAWFELLRPTAKRKNVFAEKYKDRVSPAAFDLLKSMFCYDPAKRPTASKILQHAYFTTEEPLSRQAIELANIGGDWHEFESKALRKENERRDREARKAAKDSSREKDKKRVTESHDRERSAKRIHVDQKPADNRGSTTTAATTTTATKE